MTQDSATPQGSNYLLLVLVAGAVIIADQWSKALVLAAMPLYHSKEIIPGFFHLTHVQNPGGAFGFMAGQSPWVRKLLFSVVATLAVGLIFYFYRQVPRRFRWLSFGLALILGGAVGNLIDRFRFGQVVDFLDLFIESIGHWPTFNVADSAISVGIAIFLIHLIFRRLPE
ncbi:MAG: signal peptidase II [Desulfobacterales bacterium]